MRIGVIATLVLFTIARAEDEKKPEPSPSEQALAHVDKGRALIVKGDDTQGAIDQLQKAIGKLQKLLAKGLSAWLPAKFHDWKRGEVKVETGNWGSGEQAMQWNQARCKYTSPEGRLTIEATVSTSPQQIQGMRGMAEMYQNPQMVEAMNNNPNTSIHSWKVGEWVGWVVAQKGRDATLMAVAKKVMLTANVTSDDVSLLKKFWEAFDHKGCAAANK